MSLKERVYSVLVVSASENFNASLMTLLPGSVYDPVHVASNVSAARRRLTERAYDLVLVNSPLPDDQGIRFSIDLCSEKSTVVLLIVKSDIHAGVFDKVAEHGVFTLPKPTSKASVNMALSWMKSTRERLRRLEKKTLSIEEKMEEIRLVNRAKWLLISELKMSEPEAHRCIEKQAMDHCVSRREIAERIIKTYI